MARTPHFYKRRTDDPDWMDLTPCTVLWESDPDEFGQFAVVFQEDDGTVWAAAADMESYSLFFRPVWLYRKQAG